MCFNEKQIKGIKINIKKSLKLQTVNKNFETGKINPLSYNGNIAKQKKINDRMFNKRKEYALWTNDCSSSQLLNAQQKYLSAIFYLIIILWDKILFFLFLIMQFMKNNQFLRLRMSSPVVVLYLPQNLENHPLEALKFSDWLISIAAARISFYPFIKRFLIFSYKVISILWSVGLPPPSFLSQPFFLHLSKFLFGMPYSFAIYLISCPLRILNKMRNTLSTAIFFSSSVYFL